MDCTQCRKEYVKYTHYYTDYGAPGGESSIDMWVLRTDKEAADGQGEKLKRGKEKISAIARIRYEQQWLSHFDKKSKKDIWEELRTIEKFFSSLGTFYKHTKGNGAKPYLQYYLRYDKLNIVFEILGIEDTEIKEEMKEIVSLQEEHQRTMEKMIEKARLRMTELFEKRNVQPEAD